MKKVEAVLENNKLLFDHYVVRKESENSYGIYARKHSEAYGAMIASATTLKAATNKAKLLEKGYRAGYDDADYFHRQWR